MRKPGLVSLVGAGPGDPGLITVRGRECLREADCIVYDALADRALLEHARSDAELVYVGKRAGQHSMKQDEICALLVQKANQHGSVCRLKGGDPFVFGRGGEEALYLREHGVPFEIVPGVTSAVAAPAYAGIPLTHRAVSASFAVITGHEDPTKAGSSINWEHLAAGVDTLVFLMGVGNLRELAENLMAHGRAPDTPVAVVRWGTTPRQQTLVGPLKGIADLCEQRGFSSPAAIVVGPVVALREQLAWFEDRPLFGVTVVVTRARAQASDLSKSLAELGAAVVEVPAIRIVEPESFEALDGAIGRLSSFDCLVFTSANGVEAFIRRLAYQGLDIRALAGLEIACIGPKTAAALERRGVKVLGLPERFVAEGLVELFSGQDLRGKRVLIPRAAEARDVLQEALTEMGAQVDVATAYRMVREEADTGELVEALQAGTIDAVTFASGGTVKQFLSLLGEDRAVELLSRVTIASIGPITTKAAEESGLTVGIEAQESTIEGLVQAIVRHVAARKP